MSTAKAEVPLGMTSIPRNRSRTCSWEANDAARTTWLRRASLLACLRQSSLRGGLQG